MKYLLLLLPMFLLGCADSSSTGSIREYDIRVEITGNDGPVSLTFPLNVDAASETTQTTDQDATATPAIRVQLSEGGLMKTEAPKALEAVIPKPQTP